MRVIYSLSHLQDWVPFATEMKNRLGWDPVFWLTTTPTEELVKKEFPAATRQSYRDIIAGINPEGMDLFAPNGIGDDTLHEFAWEMDQAIKMMDRLDSGGAFSYAERKNYFVRILNHSLNVIERFKPQLILFTETPHHATQYILYAACRHRGVHTLMFKPVYAVGSRVLIYNCVEDDPFVTMGSLTFQAAGEQDVALYKSYVETLTGTYQDAQPYYMREQQRTSSHSQVMVRTAGKLIKAEKLKNLLDRRRATNILKLKNTRIEYSAPNRLQLYWLKAQGSRKKKRLQRVYQSLTTAVPEGVKFVFVPLQYQPERTSSPDGGTFVMQSLMIGLLRRVLPDHIHIVVKEHTSQFHPKYDGHLGREAEDYHHLVRMRHVHLVRTDIPSFELLDKCLAVATLTGTIGLEGVARKKSVLVFGSGCWYKSLPGVFYTPTEQRLREAVSGIERGVKPPENALLDFLLRFHSISFVAIRNPESLRPLSVEENVTALTNAVCRYVKEVMKLHAD